jgi:predicted RNase H-like nuclease (RuvC/YqgF family)
MQAFQQAQKSADPQSLILAEYTFITQELQLTEKSDKHTIDSLTAAIQSFDDAFSALKVVENRSLYQGTDKTIPHAKKYRVKGGYPKDAYHIAFESHKTRLQNILRTPGLDRIEKTLLEQRRSNLATAQQGYIEKQKKVLGN